MGIVIHPFTIAISPPVITTNMTLISDTMVHLIIPIILMLLTLFTIEELPLLIKVIKKTEKKASTSAEMTAELKNLKKEIWANEKFDTPDIRKKNKAYDQDG